MDATRHPVNHIQYARLVSPAMPIVLSIILTIATFRGAFAAEPAGGKAAQFQMLVPGFAVKALPVDLRNVNAVRYREDGKLIALGYDGKVYVLSDSDGDGLEDKVSIFYDPGREHLSLSMALTPPGYRHGNGVFIARKGALVLEVDTDGDDRADKEIVVASHWETPARFPGGASDAIGVAVHPDGSVYFGLGAANSQNGYLLSQGVASYRTTSERGTVQRVAPDFSKRETVATGVRATVGMAFNAAGDLFATDQEGATWMPNGNPLDELLHIQTARHYGFPPRHPKHLPGVIDEPSVFDYGPQHQSTCGVQFNEPIQGGPVFGPTWWRGDAFVAGESRGKIYRTQLIKTPFGYIARNQIIACLSWLAIDQCVSPQGDLVVTAHSGPPDWGTGPAGRGRIFKVSPIEPESPQPVLTYMASPAELRIAFDHPLPGEVLEELSSRIRIAEGVYVKEGDRFESFRPGYRVISMQKSMPRRWIAIQSVNLSDDRRTMIIKTPERSLATPCSIDINGWPRSKAALPGELAQSNTVSVGTDHAGVAARGVEKDGTRSWSGWLPHFDLQAARALTKSSAEHDRFWELLKLPGTLTLHGQIDAWRMLRPALQAGTKLDADLPDERVTIRFESIAGATMQTSDPRQMVVETRNETVHGKLHIIPKENSWIPVEVSIPTGPAPVELRVSWSTDEDERPRALPLRRMLLPWAQPNRETIRLEPPKELAGGDWHAGERTFATTCVSCHALNGKGGQLGPDLSNLRYRDYASVYKDIVDPNATIHPDHVGYLVTLKNGEVINGVILEDQGDRLMMATATAPVQVPKSDIAKQRALSLSFMPEGMLEALGEKGLRDLLTFLLVPPPVAQAPGPEVFEEDRLEREILLSDCADPLQLQVAKNGDIYFIERRGVVKRYSPKDRSSQVVLSLPTAVGGEYGLLGLALAPDFEHSAHVYLLYSPKDAAKLSMRLSRFSAAGGKIDPASEKSVMEYGIDTGGHQGGGMQFDGKGDLWIGVGDNTPANVAPATDQRPGRTNYDALRSSANSQDLRGKVLRIHPQPDGTYTIPAGNLFADPKDGRPEIYAMGCRNPIRISVDSPTNALFWGDVGSNTDEKFGSGGFDEINRAAAPGNHGWPLFAGPNLAYVRFNHETGKMGEKNVPDRPVNDSINNTGLKELPPARPPLLWYPSEDSTEFPELGNGGRAAMAGPLYRFDSALTSSTKLPQQFDGQLFIYDWCRNWIKAVAMDAKGQVTGVRPFLPNLVFRRPIDLKVGPDGALYLIEYGDKWGGNKDGQISRIIYRRGNRPPRAVASASVLAGQAPLEVRFSAAQSSDPDGDALTYRWTFGDGDAAAASAAAREATHVFRTRGLNRAILTVTDARGLSHSAALSISVGNSPPAVSITRPVPGGFFAWGETIPYEVSVSDAEDGGTAGGAIPPESVRVRWTYNDQPAAAAGAIPEIGHDGGAAVIRRGDCLTCHALATPSIGPSFLQIADRYRGDKKAPALLAEKVAKGGSGNWGEAPMLPHPQTPSDDLNAMVAYILDVKPPESGKVLLGVRGETVAGKPAGSTGGTYTLRASYTDKGAPGVQPMVGEAKVVLHALRSRAALFDESRNATVMEVATLRRERRICVQLSAGGHLVFKDVNLAGIARVHFDVSASSGHGGLLELRAGGPSGTLVGSVPVPVTGQWDFWKKVTADLRDPGGMHDLYVVAAKTEGGETKRFNLDVLEFERSLPVPSPAAAQTKPNSN